MEITLKVKRFYKDAVLPCRAIALAAGYDLASCEDVVIPAWDSGVGITIPNGCYGRIAPCSSLAWNHKIAVGTGVIDADYCHIVHVILFNHSHVPFNVKKGDRIAQLIVEKIAIPKVIEVDKLEPTQRGGGFGSTDLTSE